MFDHLDHLLDHCRLLANRKAVLSRRWRLFRRPGLWRFRAGLRVGPPLRQPALRVRPSRGTGLLRAWTVTWRRVWARRKPGGDSQTGRAEPLAGSRERRQAEWSRSASAGTGGIEPSRRKGPEEGQISREQGEAAA